MRTKLFVLLTALTLTVARGQQAPIPATTDDGRKILVYPDGTWKPADEVRPGGSPGSNNPSVTNNPPAGNAKVFEKAPQGLFGVWVDEQKWTKTQSDNPAIKTTFIHKGEDSYAMIIGERVQLSLNVLKKAAMTNAKKVAPDATVIFEERRLVNGRQVLCLEITGTLQQTAFIYYGYYYGGPEGTLQVICYTTPNLFDQYKSDFDEFLSGIQIGQPMPR